MSATATTGRKRKGAAPRGVPYLFLAPAILLFTLFLLLPIGYAIYLSFRQIKVSGLGLGKGSRTEIWAGLDNYRAALGDPELLGSALRVLAYGAVLIPIMLGLALLFALLLDAPRVRFGRFAKLAIFLPYAVPGVIASMLWGFLYLPAVSPFNHVLSALGLPEPDPLNGGSVFFAIVNIAVWGGVGFNMIVLFTSLRAVPGEIYESASIDGASDLQIALRIKIPLLMPSLIMTTVFSLIATLQVFTEPLTIRSLTNSISSSWTPLMKVYRDAFSQNDIYSAAASSVVIALVTLLLSFGFLRLVSRQAFGGENR